MKNQRILYLIERCKEWMLTIVILIEVWDSKPDKSDPRPSALVCVFSIHICSSLKGLKEQWYSWGTGKPLELFAEEYPVRGMWVSFLFLRLFFPWAVLCYYLQLRHGLRASCKHPQRNVHSKQLSHRASGSTWMPLDGVFGEEMVIDFLLQFIKFYLMSLLLSALSWYEILW